MPFCCSSYNELETCTKNSFNNARLNFPIWLSFISVLRILSHKCILILRKSPWITVKITFSVIYNSFSMDLLGAKSDWHSTLWHRTTFSFLFPAWRQETDANVHSGFEAKYNMKTSVRHLTSWDTVSLQNAVVSAATVSQGCLYPLHLQYTLAG